jgi:hypothetical protein
MVDVKNIQKLLRLHFVISGDVLIDPVTGAVDVQGDVRLGLRKRAQFPVRFGKVLGNFVCSDNYIESLWGAPHHVGGHFRCGFNRLTSLEHAPQHVGGHFRCDFNRLTSLEHAPQHVGGDFWCDHNQLTSLEHAPQHVGGDFWCQHNPLTSLEHAPQHVGGEFKFDYQRHMPLLRFLAYHGLVVFGAPDQVESILNKYAGKGKSGMLNCALELKQAGFEGNARW